MQSNFQENCMNKALNKKEIIVHAIRRSGQHGIIEWILQNSFGKYCFLNDPPPGKNPYNPAYINEKHKNSEIDLAANRLVTNIPDLNTNTTADEFRQITKDLLIYNYESRPFNKIFTEQFIKNKSSWIGNSENTINLLILRDPLNNFASTLNHKWMSIKTREELKDWRQKWLSHAEEFISNSQVLSNKICVLYNNWILKETYRSDIAQSLNLHNSKDNDKIARWGRGSSFGTQTKDITDDKKLFLFRYKKFMEDDRLKILITDQMIEYCEIIFANFDCQNELIEDMKTLRSSY